MEWSHLLDELDFPYLHTSEFVGLDGVHAKHRSKIKREDVGPILFRFADIIQKYVAFGYGVGVDTKHYRSMSQAFRDKIKNPQFVAFKMAMTMIVKQVDVAREMRPAISWKAGIICDQDPGTADHCLKWFNSLNGLCFADSTGIPPVQAADLLAYALRTEGRAEKNWQRGTAIDALPEAHD